MEPGARGVWEARADPSRALTICGAAAGSCAAEAAPCDCCGCAGTSPRTDAEMLLGFLQSLQPTRKSSHLTHHARFPIVPQSTARAILALLQMALLAGRTGLGAVRRMAPAAARGFATEKQIALRIAATSNLKKVSCRRGSVGSAGNGGDERGGGLQRQPLPMAELGESIQNGKGGEKGGERERRKHDNTNDAKKACIY